jgi:uncharacterized protein involved in exopolysaccharide biosynthesis
VEIADYLRIAKRRAAILIAVPLLAGGLAVADVVTAPPQYSVTAHVSGASLAGEETGAYAGPTGVEHFVNDLTASVTSGAVARAAAKKTGVPADAISDGIEASSGEGSVVEITYTTTNREDAKPVASAVASASLKRMFAPTVNIATARADLAQGSLRDAGSAVRKYEEKHTTVAESPTEAPIGVQAEYQSLLAEQSAARSAVSSAMRSLAEAKAQVSAASSTNPTEGTAVSQDPLLPRILGKGLPAAGTGLFLAIGLVALLELLFPHRRRAAASAAHHQETEPAITGTDRAPVLEDRART